MPRASRACQFAPFDALKGLNDALRLKEYEHERIMKNDLSEEKIIEISKTLSIVKKSDIIKVVYYNDGYLKQIMGKSKINIEENYILIKEEKIKFDNLIDIKIV